MLSQLFISPIFLKTDDDWEHWSNVFIAKAKVRHVWDKIKPGATEHLLEKTVFPTISEHHSDSTVTFMLAKFEYEQQQWVIENSRLAELTDYHLRTVDRDVLSTECRVRDDHNLSTWYHNLEFRFTSLVANLWPYQM